jgi:hypothetical protein
LIGYARVATPLELAELGGADHRFSGATSQWIGAVVPWLVVELFR